MICNAWDRHHISYRIIFTKETDEFGSFYWCPKLPKCKYCDGIIGEDNHLWQLFKKVEKLRKAYLIFKKEILVNHSIKEWF